MPQSVATDIYEAILKLADNPFPKGSLKLEPKSENLYRIRSGNYRIIYSVDNDILRVLVLKIGDRKDIYR